MALQLSYLREAIYNLLELFWQVFYMKNLIYIESLNLFVNSQSLNSNHLVLTSLIELGKNQTYFNCDWRNTKKWNKWFLFSKLVAWTHPCRVSPKWPKHLPLPAKSNPPLKSKPQNTCNWPQTTHIGLSEGVLWDLSATLTNHNQPALFQFVTVPFFVNWKINTFTFFCSVTTCSCPTTAWRYWMFWLFYLHAKRSNLCSHCSLEIPWIENRGESKKIYLW